MPFSTFSDEDLQSMYEYEQNLGVLPWQYYKEVMQMLQILKCKFLTAHDLDFQMDFSILTPQTFMNAFAVEFCEWRQTSHRDTAYYVLLHDCDAAPRKIIEMCKIDAEMGVRSTLAVYANYPHNGKVARFPADFSEVKALQDMGFAITYHCNAATCYHFKEYNNLRILSSEREGVSMQQREGIFDEQGVFDNYDQDVEFLRKQGLDIRWYSPCSHNRKYFYPASVRNKMPSTHNQDKYGVLTDVGYTDDNIFKSGDIRTFLKSSVSPGLRHYILLHPVYYGANDDTTARIRYFDIHPFIKEYWELYNKNQTDIYWKDTMQTLIRKKVLAEKSTAGK